ncbi:peptide/nickel transport system substrate-binding protein [Halogranum gelatinilyticum]|uniref:Peptide/nickel transport system substrate-binding protein n=1 Tax=Halogranum gelatinilyticum TaxID=660521 RepID=A0A1G9YR51_9EURY|nr:ABC transporter substrate-binding protein [Halogranum gelatinilyticum]SDN11075.1 peptide/nickel transport system substrate-binding protein [Halogranum gelatinilyticum]
MSNDHTVDAQRDLRKTRRRFMQAVGAAGAASIAGCAGSNQDAVSTDESATESSGDGSDGGDSETTQDSMQMTDRTFTTATTSVPKDMQFNPYGQKYPDRAALAIFENLLYVNEASSTFMPGILESWDIGSETVTLSVRDGYHWHSGEAVTAEDVAFKLELEIHNGAAISNVVAAEDVTVADESTVELGLKRAVSDKVFLYSLKPIALDTPPAEFQEFLDAYRQDGEAPELAEKTLEEPNGTGPFQFVHARNQELVTERFADHPDADKINFPRMKWSYLQSNQKQWTALRSNTIDGIDNVFTPENIAQSYGDHIREIQMPANWGMGVMFNHEHEHYSQQNVKQAIQYVIDREKLAQTAGGKMHVPVEVPSGLPGNFDGSYKEWLGESLSDFDAYEPNTEKAAQLLNEAGFSKQDGSWVDANGKPLEFPYKIPSGWNDWTAGGQSIVQDLNDFGIDASLNPSQSYWGDIYGNQEYVVAGLGWPDGKLYPYFSLNKLLNGTRSRDILKFPREVEVPPIGEPEGETRTVELEAELQELAGLTGEEAKQKTQELAWVVNQHLPMAPLMEKVDQSWVTTDDWNTVTADDEDAIVDWPQYYLPREGKLTAKPE